MKTEQTFPSNSLMTGRTVQEFLYNLVSIYMIIIVRIVVRIFLVIVTKSVRCTLRSSPAYICCNFELDPLFSPRELIILMPHTIPFDISVLAN